MERVCWGRQTRCEWDGRMQGLGKRPMAAMAEKAVCASKDAQEAGGVKLRKPALKLMIALTAALALAACESAPTKKRSSEYFPESKYGVKASPRVVADGKPVPKGGGRAIVGKPYKVAGRWYYPKEEPGYTKVGFASWYGEAFHGRKTANGEIYDRHSLTAAHTTMPLPSYARVTNLKNGRSIVVRVNDRGPFHGNRVIDLSRRTAEILDFHNDGIAKVKVAYVGPARIDGQDEDFLLASYKGPGAPSGAKEKKAPERSIFLASRNKDKQTPNRSQRVAPRREVLTPDSPTSALLAYNESQPRKQRAVPLHAAPPALASAKTTPAPAARTTRSTETLPGVAASAPEPTPAPVSQPEPEPTYVQPAPAQPQDAVAETVELAAQQPASEPAPMVVASADPADADPIASRILAAYSSVGTSSGLDANAIAASAGKSGLAPIE